MHETLCVGIQIRASSREHHWAHRTQRQDLAEGRRKQRVPVMDKVARVPEKAVHLVQEAPGDVAHPSIVRLMHDPGDGDPAALQVDYEQDVVPDKPMQCEHLHREEVCRSYRAQ